MGYIGIVQESTNGNFLNHAFKGFSLKHGQPIRGQQVVGMFTQHFLGTKGFVPHALVLICDFGQSNHVKICSTSFGLPVTLRNSHFLGNNEISGNIDAT